MISEEESREMRPDYYLVLPWHFLDEFIEREHEYLDAGRQLHHPAARGASDRRGGGQTPQG